MVLNVTVTQPTADGFLTAWPAGPAWPGSSNLNFVAGQTVANVVVVKVGEGGRVDLLNSAGPPTSWRTSPVGTGASAGARGTTGSRRRGSSTPASGTGRRSRSWRRRAGEWGVGGDVNLTATGSAPQGFLTAWPAGDPLPLASNVNYSAGQSAPNLVTVTVGAGGAVNLYRSGGPVDVVADVSGYYGADGAVGGSGFIAIDPARLLDTRTGLGSNGPHKLVPVSADSLTIAGQGGVPPTGVAAVVLNVTVTEPESEGCDLGLAGGRRTPAHLEPELRPRPDRANLVVVKVGFQGQVNLYTRGPVHLVADVMGWFPG